MHDSALAVRRPGECTFFTPGCEIEVDKVEFTPEMIRVRVFKVFITNTNPPSETLYCCVCARVCSISVDGSSPSTAVRRVRRVATLIACYLGSCAVPTCAASTTAGVFVAISLSVPLRQYLDAVQGGYGQWTGYCLSVRHGPYS